MKFLNSCLEFAFKSRFHLKYLIDYQLMKLFKKKVNLVVRNQLSVSPLSLFGTIRVY